MKKLIKKGKSGFTLVELVIVIAILAIVAAIAIPTASNVIGNANKTADLANAQSIEMAIKTCQAESLANATTPSTIIASLSSKTKVTELLAAYNVTLDLTKLRQSNNYYFYDTTSGKITVGAAGASGIGTQLTAASTFTIATDGKLTINP